MRLKINQVQLNKGPRIEEGVVSRQRFTQDRQLETQAAIVRAMKRHQELSHSELVREVIKLTQNRGMLDVAEVKTNIERYVQDATLPVLIIVLPLNTYPRTVSSRRDFWKGKKTIAISTNHDEDRARHDVEVAILSSFSPLF